MNEKAPEAKSGTSTTPETQAPQPEAPKTDAEKAKAEAEAKAKKEEGKECVRGQAKEALEQFSGMLGGDFGLLMKQLFSSIEKIVSSFDGIKDKIGDIFLAQTPEGIQKIMDGLKNYKVPKIQNVDTITATIENPQPDEKLVVYLYRCLKVPVPTAEQLDPSKTLDMRHLLCQMMGSFQSAKGKEAIVKGFTEKPEKFFKDDIVFFANKFDDKLTAGFVQSIGKDTITITTIDETGTQRTIPKRKSMCLMAFHIPGNKTKGPAPIEKKDEKKDDPKPADKPADAKVDQ